MNNDRNERLAAAMGMKTTESILVYDKSLGYGVYHEGGYVYQEGHCLGHLEPPEFDADHSAKAMLLEFILRQDQRTRIRFWTALGYVIETKQMQSFNPSLPIWPQVEAEVIEILLASPEQIAEAADIAISEQCPSPAN